MVEIEDVKLQEMEQELEALRPLKDTSEKLQEEFKAKTSEWQAEKVRLEADVNPNWQKARHRIEGLEKIVADKGVKVDEDGNVIGSPQQVNIEEITTKAREAAKQEIMSGEINKRLSEYDEKSGQLVKHFFDKLSAGENLTLGNLDKFIKQAHNAAEVESGAQIKKSGAMTFSGGQGPRMQDANNTVDEGVISNLAKSMGLPIGKEQ